MMFYTKCFDVQQFVKCSFSKVSEYAFFVINTERMSPNSENIASVTVCTFPCCCFVLKYCVCEHILSYFVGFIECV